MAFTLISIGCLTRARLNVSFVGNSCKIGYPNGRTVRTVPYTEGLYQLVAAIAGELNTKHVNVAVTRMSLYEAHQKLGHGSLKHNSNQNDYWY